VDVGVSGAKDSRPELNRLMADAHKRRFDVVCVWKFDRFARSTSHLLRALETFRALGVEFCSYPEQLDTSTPPGKMVFTVLGAVAELERSLITGRVRGGLRNSKAKGKRLGRPSALVSDSQIVEMLAARRVYGDDWSQARRFRSHCLPTRSNCSPPGTWACCGSAGELSCCNGREYRCLSWCSERSAEVRA